MSRLPLTFIRCCGLIACIGWIASVPAAALIIRGYNNTDHKRFIPFPVDPEINNSSIFSGVDLTGVGYRMDTSFTVIGAMVSRQHVIFATHYAIIRNTDMGFVNASGQVIVRRTNTGTAIFKDGIKADLTIYKLASPIDADTGITPLPYYDGGSYVGLQIGVMGLDNTGGPSARFPVMGAATISEVLTDLLDATKTQDGSIMTKAYQFDYSLIGGADDCYFENNDSGGPTFVPVGNKAALIGTHTSVDTSLPPPYENFDTLVPHYITEIDAVLGPTGYRMRPVGAPATTLVTTTSTLQTTPRRMMPLDFVCQVENTGGELTGNVEVEFLFDPAEAPDSVSGPAGWVVYGSGAKWTMRRATLAAAGLTSVTAHWAEAPAVESLSFTMTRRSDTTADQVTAVDLPLAGSYAEWSAGLADAGLTADLDLDGLDNLQEYAFGGDAESGNRTFADGSPLPVAVSNVEGDITVSFPERSDAADRGLGYGLEFSPDLATWSGTMPDGFSTMTEAYDPPVSGFVRRVCSWPASETDGFLRIVVTLDE